MNKILIKHCVIYYQKYWKHRNEIYKDREKQGKRAIEWCNAMKRHVENGDLMQVKAFVRRNKINLQTAYTDMIIQWIYNIKEMIKKASEFPRNDIRRYFKI